MINTSLSLTLLVGARIVFIYSSHGMLGNFCCTSVIVIGLYNLEALRRSSSGSDICEEIINVMQHSEMLFQGRGNKHSL